MSLENPTFQASGNISPSRFVAGVSGITARVFQATATDAPVGISQQGLRRYDSTYAAATGEPLRVYGPGEEAMLELGGTVSAFDWLAPDADGKGVKVTLNTTAIQYPGAQALMNGVSGALIRARTWLAIPTGTN